MIIRGESERAFGGAEAVPVHKPIFFIGMPRSGTTIIFETFSAHEQLGWFSNYFDRYPIFPCVSVLSRLAKFDRFRGQKRQGNHRATLGRYQISPAETYSVWDRYGREKFSRDYLLEARAEEEEKRRLREVVSKVLTYQGKPRFANKLTGPPRITYLNSIFPDALFVHIVRDGRAVVNSLMNVGFWSEKGGLNRPFWKNGLPEEYIGEWERSGRSALVLAAVQWKNVIELARKEAHALAAERYVELKYEEFLRSPHDCLTKLNRFCSLPPSEAQRRYLSTKLSLKDMNSKYRGTLRREELSALGATMNDLLSDLGYPL